MNKGMGFLRKFLIILFFYTAVITEGYNRGRSMSMKWSFSGPLGSMQDLGLIGDQGEFYFHPAKRAHLHISSSAIDSPLRIPICFWPKVISPSGSDLVSIVEMKHRQLLQDVGEGGLIGFAYLSSANQKISLIGTLMQVKKTRSLSDGRVLVMVESIKRFFFDIFTQEVPYHIAVVRPFSDICNHISERDDLQVKLCNLAQLNMKVS